MQQTLLTPYIIKISKKMRNRAAQQMESLLLPDYNIKHHHQSAREALAIFPKLGLVFNRIKKSGNSSLVAFFSELSKWDCQTPKEANDLACCPKVFGPRAAMKVKNYHSAVFIRDPHSRVLSAFRHKVGSGKSQEYSSFPGFSSNDADGFARFVSFLEEGGLYANRHWWPQVDLLFKPLKHFSFVGRLEALETDMASLLSTLGQDPQLAVKLAQPNNYTKHITNSSTAFDHFYTSCLRSRVSSLYRRDFDSFGHLLVK